MEPARDKPQQFSIATLLLVMTLIGVCLALFRVSTGVGAAALLFIVPAFLRTMSLAEREKQFANRLSAAEKVAVYLGSLAVTFLVLIAMAATFVVGDFVSIVVAAFVAQWDRELAERVSFPGITLSVVLALVAGGWTIRRMWPSREEFLAALNRPGPAAESKPQ
jgi:hypothetical protein